MAGVGAVPGNGSGIQRLSDSVSPVGNQKASQSGKLNRSSISDFPPTNYFQNTDKTSSHHPKSLSDYKMSALPDKVVKPQLSQPENSAEQRLKTKAKQLQNQIAAESQIKLPAVKTRSENVLKEQVRKASTALDNAHRLKREAKTLAKESLRGANYKEMGLGGHELSSAGREASRAYDQANDLVKTRRKVLTQAKADLKELQREVRQEKSNARRSAQAQSDLQSRSRRLDKAANGIRSKTVEASNGTSRELGKELTSLRQAMRKAKRVEANGNSLIQRATTKSGRHGFGVRDIKAQAGKSIKKAQAEIISLKREIRNIQGKKKTALKSEARERAENRRVQREHKRLERAEKARARRRAKGAPKAETRQEPAAVKGNQPPEPHKRTGKTAREESLGNTKSTSKKDVNAYLKGITPSKNLSSSTIQGLMMKLDNPGDFKQVMVDIRASDLPLKEKVQLRSMLSAALLGAIKNEQRFSAFNKTDVEHIMFGDNMKDVKAAFTKAVERERRKLDKRTGL